MDDRELVRRCIRGEADAWRSLVEQHLRVMRALALGVLPPTDAREGEAEDVLQAVFLKLWADDRRRLRSFRGTCRLGTWLGAVTRREALDRLRRGERRARHVHAAREEALRRFWDVTAGDGDPAQAERLDADARRQHFREAVARLAPRERLLVRLVYQDGCTYGEAARLLGAPENSIGPWLKRAQDRLRTLLVPEAGPDRTDRAPGDL